MEQEPKYNKRPRQNFLTSDTSTSDTGQPDSTRPNDSHRTGVSTYPPLDDPGVLQVYHRECPSVLPARLPPSSPLPYTRVDSD